MDEIEQLQRQLKQLQSQTAAYKLSDRNCVELIMKLIKMGKIQLIFTMNGKEYLTLDQLEREIEDEILAHQG
jgi:hypothetical protein